MTQLKVIQGDRSKGKSSSKLHQVAEELDYLFTFNQSIKQAMARTMQDLSEGVFINITNLTLACWDSYLNCFTAGIKQDTLPSLRTAPLHMSSLFLDHLISKAEEEIRHHEDKRSAGPAHKKLQHFYPHSQARRQKQESDQKSGPPAWKQLKHYQNRTGRGKA